MNQLSENEIADRINKHPQKPAKNPYPVNYFNRPRKRAAVLIPLTKILEEWHLLFIRRTVHERDHHGGQVAFPGGGQDDIDTDIQGTALREANEEVGLLPDDVRILGQLGDVISITNYLVTPIVGSFPSPYNFRPDKKEVASIFSIPLNWLSTPGNYETRYRQVDDQKPWPVIYFKEYNGELLWGFTAGLTIKLLELLQ